MRFKTYAIITAFICALTGCTRLSASSLEATPNKYPDVSGTHKSTTTIQGKDYFPPSFVENEIACDNENVSSRIPIISEFERKWYSTHLQAAGEPSLYLTARTSREVDQVSLRFIWLRSFHPPVIIRIEGHRYGAMYIIAKQLSGAGGYDPGYVVKQLDRPLTDGEIDQVRTTLDRANPSQIASVECEIGFDGAQWIFEIVDGQGYHFFNRWSPRKGEVRDLGIFFLRLTGWKIKDIY